MRPIRLYKIWTIVVCLCFGLYGHLAYAENGDSQTKRHIKDQPTHAAPHWSYEGHDGPENWGALDGQFSICSNGSQQSPIDLKNARAVIPEPIDVKWKSFIPHVVNG